MRPLPTRRHPTGAGEISDAFVQSFIWIAALLAVYFRNRSMRAAEAWMNSWERAGFFHSAVLDVCMVEPPAGPLHVQRVGDAEPNYNRLAYQLECRWNIPARRRRVYWPSMEFARFYGHWTGSDTLLAPHKVSHDLLCSSVWLAYLHRHPGVALKCWTSERCLQYRQRCGDASGPIPDALLKTRHGKTAIEIGGRYPADWIRHHCKRCIAAGYSWILW